MDHLQPWHMPRPRRPGQDIWTERRTRVSPATTAKDHRTTSSAASAQSGRETRSCVEVTQFVFHYVVGSLLWFTTSQTLSFINLCIKISLPGTGWLGGQ